jgi:ATP-binding cassette subfamily B protein
VSTVAHESIDGALVVKTLGREESEVERLAREADALRVARVEVGWLRAGFTPAFEALPVLGMILLLAIGTWRVSTGALTVGTLVQFVVLFQLLAFPIAVIGYALAEVPRAVVSRDRLERVFTEPIGQGAAGDSLPLPPGPLSVSVRAVGYGHGDQRVLDGMSFEIPPATTVALVGVTGSGKSTLAELLVRLADPKEGSIHLGGVDLRHLDAGELRATTALVFQESFLFATTLRENITLGASVPEEAVRRAARIAQAERFIDALPEGLDTVVGERGVTLSGGQRQRVALARALVREPRLLILDDATSAVDPTVEADILAGLRRDLDATLVMVAYRTSTIALADQVLFLEDGRVAATGTHRELLATKPAYAAMTSAYERGRR